MSGHNVYNGDPLSFCERFLYVDSSDLDFLFGSHIRHNI